MNILGYFLGYPPQARVGSWIAMHPYMAGLAAAGHKVTVQIPDRIRTYVLDGVTVEHLGANFWPRFFKVDVCISIHGDDARMHRTAMHEKVPSVRFIHGTHDTLFHNLVKHGDPTLVVFNSHSLADYVNYPGAQMVCHPFVDPLRFTTTPGEHVTLVNLIDSKGYQTFDQLARYMPKRPFLGVRGGYGPQDDSSRPNVKTINPTSNMRDDVLARTRIMLMPSEHETWGMVGVEAMCAGIPVVAHPTPGLLESLGDAGLFAERNDLDAWIDIIEDLDNPAKYKAASKRAKARADQLAKDDGVARFVKAVEELA